MWFRPDRQRRRLPRLGPFEREELVAIDPPSVAVAVNLVDNDKTNVDPDLAVSSLTGFHRRRVHFPDEKTRLEQVQVVLARHEMSKDEIRASWWSKMELSTSSGNIHQIFALVRTNGTAMAFVHSTLDQVVDYFEYYQCEYSEGDLSPIQENLLRWVQSSNNGRGLERLASSRWEQFRTTTIVHSRRSVIEMHAAQCSDEMISQRYSELNCSLGHLALAMGMADAKAANI